ncbi:aspartyl protease family protein [Acidicapsa acidisoli]|uniref:aspartyl protease family protein n=1 Tax=Acidicapsa acidisoli TaxID=1615681 RepID=UPI0021DFB741|nr:aspartyl protease family protein [Acidicapsa acidisoli]
MKHPRLRDFFAWATIAVSSVICGAGEPSTQSSSPHSYAPAKGATSAPLELRHGVPFVKVMINGKGPFTFIIDTGTSSDAIVTPALAATLGLQVVERRHLTDLGGQNVQGVNVVAIQKLTVAGVDFPSVHADVHAALTTVGPYDGILGFRLFRNELMTLDYPRHRLVLSVGDSLQSGDPNVLPLHMSRLVPTVILEIGNEPVEAQIDSGGQGICVPESVAESLKFQGSLDVVARGHTQVSTFPILGGKIDEDVEFAGHTFDKPFIEIIPNFPVADVGSGTLQDFVVSFDQKHCLARFFTTRKNIRIASDWQ